MAYDPTNPPSLIGQGIGGVEGMRFFTFVWVDPIGDVLAPGYISNAEEIGMRPGDSLVYKDAAGVGEWLENHLVCMEVDANGAGTVAFPIVPEDALPLSNDYDDGDPSYYLVMYQNGRQVRIPANLYAPDGSQVASQAEAEAGVDNEKRMTALRVREAITSSGIITTLQTDLALAEAAIELLEDQIWTGDQAAYDAIAVKNPNTLYFIT